MLEYLKRLERYDAESYAVYLYARDIVTAEGTDVGMPHWKWLGDGLGELRWRNGKKRFRIYCSEESEKRVFMAHPVEKDYRTFSNDDKAICLRRRAEFRSPKYKQDHRYKLFLENQNAGNRQATDSGSTKCN